MLRYNTAARFKTNLIEMWEYFLGREYVHRRYGPTKHSLSTSPTFANGWYGRNERTIFDWEHVPSGILHVLMMIRIYEQQPAHICSLL